MAKAKVLDDKVVITSEVLTNENIERVSINNNSNITEEVKKRVNRKSIRGNSFIISGREKSKKIKIQTKKLNK